MNDDILSKIFYSAFEKVIKINLKDETFEEIKEGKQHAIEYSGIDQWFIKFSNGTTLCPCDRSRFLEFANIENFKTILADENTTDAGICYQRKINGEYHWAMMRIYRIDEENILLTVKDIDQCWLPIEAQENRGQFKSKEILIKKLQSIADKEVATGAVILEYDSSEAVEMAEVFRYAFNPDNIYQYDVSHIIVVFEDIRHDIFRGRLSQVYTDFIGYDVEIGAVWRRKIEDYADFMSALSYNLQINKPREEAE